MRELQYPLAYCTNVHAGADFASMFANLQRHAPEVKRRRTRHGPMGLGLWFTEVAVQQAAELDHLRRLRDWLDRNELIAYTANAFPQPDFHLPVVKHAVYEPTWANESRLEYTLDVFQLMDQLVPRDLEVSVSTLPLGWPRADWSAADRAAFMSRCAAQLHAVVRHLDALERRTGRLAYLCLEPEPGCVLERSEDVVAFFTGYLDGSTGGAETARRYLRVCHDVCHSAVMFEPQAAAVEGLAQAGIRIGKVQISSALTGDFRGVEDRDVERMLADLKSFAEPRYLHQTSVRGQESTAFYEDLPAALAANLDPRDTEWRVHFHVPVNLSRVSRLATTQAEIRECLGSFGGQCPPKHFEIETYAWPVLPEPQRPRDLADGIAAEMNWFESEASNAFPREQF